MALLKNSDEIKSMRRGGVIAGEVLDELIKVVRPGITTLALDTLATEWIRLRGGEPSFNRVPGYHHTLCTSINNQVVHGIPGENLLKMGDIITIDLGVYYQGYHTDTAWTVPVGQVDERVSEFLEVGKKALKAGISKAQSGRYVGDVSNAIEKVLLKSKVGIVESLTGHGVGTELHEEPMIPNYGEPGNGVELRDGMTIAIEPIYTDLDPDVFIEDDDWTIVAPNSTIAAVFEHTILVRRGKAEILTPNKQK